VISVTPDLPSITVTTVSDRKVTAALRGELDALTVPELDRAMRPYVGLHMLLDMSAVTFMDSSARQYLLTFHEQSASDGGGGVTVESPSPVVSRLLKLSGVGRGLVAD
jgi:anti-anti-sigma factor